MKFLVTPPDGSRPSLVVETRTQINEAAIQDLRAQLYGMGCPNGVLFDATNCLIFRDTFASMDKDSIIVEGTQLKTNDVLLRFGGTTDTLDRRVERWLGMLSTNWNYALSEESAVAAPFIADIVPAASGAVVHAVGMGALR